MCDCGPPRLKQMRRGPAFHSLVQRSTAVKVGSRCWNRGARIWDFYRKFPSGGHPQDPSTRKIHPSVGEGLYIACPALAHLFCKLYCRCDKDKDEEWPVYVWGGCLLPLSKPFVPFPISLYVISQTVSTLPPSLPPPSVPPFPPPSCDLWKLL